MGYVLVLLLGILTGLRTMTPIAVVCWFAYLPAAIPGDRVLMLTGWRSFTSYVVSPILFTVLALGEYIGDKLPNTPSRTSSVGLIGRILFGVFVGVLIAPRVGGHHYLKGFTGGIGAVLGTYGGWWVRTRLAARVGKDWPIANLEDWFTIFASIMILNVITHSDFFR
ncbi:DUF4126 domain-containing protein [Terriglobus aquaticus]|uniref:DUF4126 domain-containing protein n=1 Tax=Terriglobus aquaticus TaxID=940139 RepID=A0ABW9KQX8_9BACT|nr:DUF4126 domain-containing protein [Terriglobus aquaticus]